MLLYFNLFSFVSCCEARNDDSQAVCWNGNWNLSDIFKQLENCNALKMSSKISVSVKYAKCDLRI